MHVFPPLLHLSLFSIFEPVLTPRHASFTSICQLDQQCFMHLTASGKQKCNKCKMTKLLSAHGVDGRPLTNLPILDLPYAKQESPTKNFFALTRALGTMLQRSQIQQQQQVFMKLGVFCDWCPPKKLKYGKPIQDEFTLTQIVLDTTAFQ